MKHPLIALLVVLPSLGWAECRTPAQTLSCPAGFVWDADSKTCKAHPAS